MTQSDRAKSPSSEWHFMTPQLPVRDVREAQNYYRDVLGCKIAWIYGEEYGAVYNGRTEIFFSRETEAFTHGSGYGHVAVCVDDLESEYHRFSELGFKPTDMVEFAPDNNLLAKFFFVTDPDGYEIEVLQRHGHYQ